MKQSSYNSELEISTKTFKFKTTCGLRVLLDKEARGRILYLCQGIKLHSFSL
jgi:hypothetical protein